MGTKDPSELYKQDRAGFRAAFQRALEQAEPLCLHQTRAGASVTPAPASRPAPTIFSLHDLLSWDLPPVHWTVPEILPEGLTLLAGKPKTHSNTRLVVIDTWAKVAPKTDTRRCTQYEGDYDALTPLKRLAETYHVSILAVHHLRKTGASDVLDEITGSTGMTGAVDGTLILKRERGQMDATLFVTGRDVEREIARALEKNYHTTRALLCKMVESGEVSRVGGRYVALSLEIDHPPQRQEEIHRQPAIPKPGHHSRKPGSGLSMCDAVAGSTHTDYGDYDDEDIETAADGAGESSPGTLSGRQEEPHLLVGRGSFIDMERQEDGRQPESTTASPSSSNQSHHCNHCNHAHHDDPLAGSAEGVGEDPGGEASVKDGGPNGPRKPASQNRCPHHPRERLVRFDPTGQAWCDRLDCWDCYRLMKLGEPLGYGSLTDQGGKQLVRISPLSP